MSQTALEIESLIQFYQNTKNYIISKGHKKEVELLSATKFEDLTRFDFFNIYINTILGLPVTEINVDLSRIGDRAKCDAIGKAITFFSYWFERIKNIENIEEKIEFISELPLITNKTKYILIRNLGIDVIRKDRLFSHVSKRWNYVSVESIYKPIIEILHERANVIDFVLSKYMVYTSQDKIRN